MSHKQPIIHPCSLNQHSGHWHRYPVNYTLVNYPLITPANSSAEANNAAFSLGLSSIEAYLFSVFYFPFFFFFFPIRPKELLSATVGLGSILMFALVNPDCLSDLLIIETAASPHARNHAGYWGTGVPTKGIGLDDFFFLIARKNLRICNL